MIRANRPMPGHGIENLGRRPKNHPRRRVGKGWSTGDRCTTGNGPAKKQRPAARDRAAGRLDDIPAATYSPTRKPCSTIGSGGLNFRVRDGNGWIPSDVATGNLSYAQERVTGDRARP